MRSAGLMHQGFVVFTFDTPVRAPCAVARSRREAKRYMTASRELFAVSNASLGTAATRSTPAQQVHQRIANMSTDGSPESCASKLSSAT